MKYLIIAGSVLCATIVLNSCKKADHHKDVTGLTTITITTPYENQVVKNGDRVSINAKITSPAKIHGYHMWIVSNSKDTVFSKEEHVHGTDVTIADSWESNLSVVADLQLIISATIDHDGNTVKKTTKIRQITE